MKTGYFGPDTVQVNNIYLSLKEIQYVYESEEDTTVTRQSSRLKSQVNIHT